MLVPKMDLCWVDSSKILMAAPCHTIMSSRYELLILESVWIDNVELEREEVKTTCLCNVYLRSEP